MPPLIPNGPLPRGKRLFLQALLSEPCMAEDQLDALAVRCCAQYGETYPAAGLRAFIADGIRPALDKLGMDLAKGYDAVSGEAQYALINTLQEDESSKLATDFSPTEIQLFKRLLELITDNAPDFQLSSTEAVVAGRALLTSGVAAQNFLDTLVAQRWLAKTRSGQYYLGVRTTLELESLLEGRPDITACLRCRKLVTKGSRCANSACDAALHWHCIAPLFAAAGNGGKVCPQCARAWADEEHGDGEEEDHDQVVAAPARRGKGKKRASMGRMDATNMDMDE